MKTLSSILKLILAISTLSLFACSDSEENAQLLFEKAMIASMSDDFSYYDEEAREKHYNKVNALFKEAAKAGSKDAEIMTSCNMDEGTFWSIEQIQAKANADDPIAIILLALEMTKKEEEYIALIKKAIPLIEKEIENGSFFYSYIIAMIANLPPLYEDKLVELRKKEQKNKFEFLKRHENENSVAIIIDLATYYAQGKVVDKDTKKVKKLIDKAFLLEKSYKYCSAADRINFALSYSEGFDFLEKKEIVEKLIIAYETRAKNGDIEAIEKLIDLCKENYKKDYDKAASYKIKSREWTDILLIAYESKAKAGDTRFIEKLIDIYSKEIKLDRYSYGYEDPDYPIFKVTPQSEAKAKELAMQLIPIYLKKVKDGDLNIVDKLLKLYKMTRGEIEESLAKEIQDTIKDAYLKEAQKGDWRSYYYAEKLIKYYKENYSELNPSQDDFNEAAEIIVNNYYDKERAIDELIMIYNGDRYSSYGEKDYYDETLIGMLIYVCEKRAKNNELEAIEKLIDIYSGKYSSRLYGKEEIYKEKLAFYKQKQLKTYEILAQKGDETALNKLILIYTENNANLDQTKLKDFQEKLIKILKEKANAGDINAIKTLFSIYLKNKELPQKELNELGLQFVKHYKASEQKYHYIKQEESYYFGDRELALIDTYRNALVYSNASEAPLGEMLIYIYTKQAESSDTQAIRALAYIYEKGKFDIPADAQKATYWREKQKASYNTNFF